MDFAEQAWIKRAVQGDEEALVRLLEASGPSVRQDIRRRIPRDLRRWLHEDDVMQEAYAEAFLDIAAFCPESHGRFTHWLSRIAQHNLIDAIRHLTALKRDSRRRKRNAPEDFAWFSLDWLPADQTTASGAATRAELRGVLERALEQLPRSYRTVVRLYDLEHLSAQEVARRLQCSPGAVFMRRRRALDMLRQRLATFSHYA